MNQPTKSLPPIWFWIVSTIALLWNLMGLTVFGIIMSMLGNRTAMEAAKLTEDQIVLLNATPTWVNVAFGIAVVFGVLGCIGLLLRKKLAIVLLAISLVGVIAQNVYMYFLSNSIEIMGVGLSPFVIIGAIALVPFAIFCNNKSWLN